MVFIQVGTDLYNVADLTPARGMFVIHASHSCFEIERAFSMRVCAT